MCICASSLSTNIKREVNLNTQIECKKQKFFFCNPEKPVTNSHFSQLYQQPRMQIPITFRLNLRSIN